LQDKLRLLASSSALLVAAALGATSVHAQARPAATAAAADTIEELVVTAERRSQSLQDVPVAISAFTSEKRDLMGINSIQDLTNYTPGLNYSSASDRTSIRGIGRLTNAHPVAVPVAVYDDGIYTTSTTTVGKTPIFTDRVEVLRGPQGTLYGRNSIGGAINVISKRPTEDPYAEVRATVANYGRTLLEAAVSGPLTPDLQFRLAGNWEKQRDGYYTNVVPGMPSEGNVIDQFYVEGQLQAKFGDHLDGWAKAYITGWNNGSGGPGARGSYSPAPLNFSQSDLQTVRNNFACAPGNVASNVVNTSPLGCVNPASSDPRKFATNIAQTVSLDEAFGIATNLTYHFDNMDLKYAGGGINYHYTLFSDNGGGSISSFQVNLLPFNPAFPAAGTAALKAQPCAATNLAGGSCAPLTVFPRQASTYQEDYHNISHEISLASTGDSALQWIGGLYYYKEGYKQPVFTTLFDQPQLDGPITPAASAITGLVGPDFQRRLFDNRPEFEQESYATYGQLDWKFADTLKATLGLRYSHDNLRGTESVRVVCFGASACLSGSSPQVLGQSFTPPVDVTAGLVYLGGLPTGVVPGGINGSGVTFTPDGFAHRSYDHSWDATTGTAGVQWDPDRDTNLYARYSRGYLMGGFNTGVTSTAGQFPFTDAEHINDYEIGLKKAFGRTLQANLAIFYEDLRGYQAPLSVVSNSGALSVSQSLYLNVPKAVSQGAELEVTWAPIEHMSVLFNYSYDDAHVKTLSGIIDPSDPEAMAAGAKPLTALQSCTGTGSTPSASNPNPNPLCDVNTGLVQRPQDLAGNSLAQNPKNKIAAAVTYGFEFEKGTLTPEVSYIWRDKQYAGLFQRSYNEAPSWDQWDARITWKDKDNRYSIIAYIKNIGDTLGYDGGASSTRVTGLYGAATIAAAGMTPGLPSAAIPGTFNAVQKTASFNGISSTYPLTPPRTYGIEFQYRF
jgi:iron complex outermembrane receptor protein